MALIVVFFKLFERLVNSTLCYGILTGDILKNTIHWSLFVKYYEEIIPLPAKMCFDNL